MRFLIVFLALLGSFIATLPAMAERVAIQSWQNRQYACFDGTYLAASCPGNRAHVFEMEDLGGGVVAFRDPASGRYLRAGVTDQSLLALGGGQIGGWERFETTQSNGATFLRSLQNGLYVRAGIGPDTLFGAVSPHMMGWEEFRIFPVGAPASPSLEDDHELPVSFSGSWVLDTVVSAQGQSVTFNDRMARARPITIAADGQIHFSFGCNQVNGRLLQQGGRMGVAGGGMMITRMACPGLEMDLERAVMGAFNAAVTFTIHGTRLDIRDATDRVRLVLRRS